jgi:glycerophosphoryl diester phosphodiesterase
MQPDNPVFNIAHRGARSLAPENTMAAFEKAWEVGAHGIEVDIRITLDGVLVVMHDRTLARTTDIRHRWPERSNDPVSSFTLAELEQLDSGTWFIDSDPFAEIAAGNVPQQELARMRQLKVPTLAEVLTFVQEKSWYINIELKEPLPATALGLAIAQIEAAGLSAPQFGISSFNHDYLREIKRIKSDIEINALIGGSPSDPQDWGSFEFKIYNANAALTDESQIAQARSRGCRINLYTVNDPLEMSRFLAAGVDKIITDYPQILKNLAR